MTAEEEPRWLATEEVLHMHDLAITNHGGLAGVRDMNGLESAVARPQSFYLYEEERDLSALAALYAEGIMTNNHPFHDGNKRAGFSAADMFLFLNGRDLQPAIDQEQRVRFFEGVASGTISREELSQFYRDNSIDREQKP